MVIKWSLITKAHTTWSPNSASLNNWNEISGIENHANDKDEAFLEYKFAFHQKEDFSLQHIIGVKKENERKFKFLLYLINYLKNAEHKKPQLT